MRLIGYLLVLLSWYLLVRSILACNKALVVLCVALIALNNHSLSLWTRRERSKMSRR